MPSVVNLRSFVQASNVSIVVPADMQRKYRATPRRCDRNHKVTYPCEAAAGHALDGMPSHETHRAVCRISGGVT